MRFTEFINKNMLSFSYSQGEYVATEECKRHIASGTLTECEYEDYVAMLKSFAICITNIGPRVCIYSLECKEEYLFFSCDDCVDKLYEVIKTHTQTLYIPYINIAINKHSHVCNDENLLRNLIGILHLKPKYSTVKAIHFFEL